MDLAKVSADGKVTIPVEIRSRPQLKEDDKLLFIERSRQLVIDKASSASFGGRKTPSLEPQRQGFQCRGLSKLCR